MKAEEQSVIGVLLVLFGVTWIGFAAVQPIPVYTVCYNGFPASNGGPSCGFPGTIAVLFYILGVAGIVIGVVLLSLRVKKSG
jgi:hypothetical protein